MSSSQKHRAIGIDYGLARIGLAISDEQKIISSPLSVITAEKKITLTAQKIANAIQDLQTERKFECDAIIIGMPYRMNGSLGVMADEVKQFADLLKEWFSCSIILWDERLSSVQADRALRECQLNRKQRSQRVDCVSAALILQAYLDSSSLFRQQNIEPKV